MLNNRASNLVCKARIRARKWDLPFDLHHHIDDLQQRINKGSCELTGYPLDLGPAKGRTRIYNAPSIDRIVPEKGYVYDNVRVVCFAANAAMGDWGEDKIRDIMRHWLV